MTEFSKHFVYFISANFRKGTNPTDLVPALLPRLPLPLFTAVGRSLHVLTFSLHTSGVVSLVWFENQMLFLV